MAEKKGKERAKSIAKIRARSVKNKLENSRPRSPVGCPVSYSCLHNEALAGKKGPRSMSDPVIPGNLVIYDKKGLFQKKNGGKIVSEQKTSCDSANRATLLDPFEQNKRESVRDLASQFEAVASLETATSPKIVGEFFNPLHKENRAKEKSPQISRNEEEVVESQSRVSVEPLKTLPKPSASFEKSQLDGIPKKPQKPLPPLPIRKRVESDPPPVTMSVTSDTSSLQVQSTIDEKQSQERISTDLSGDNEWAVGDSLSDYDSDWDSDFDSSADEDESTESPQPNHEYPPSTDQMTMVFPDPISKKLYNIALEILTTERTYVRRLHLLDKVFLFRLNSECCAKGILPREVLTVVFSNIQAIHQLHQDFLLPKLEERMNQWSTVSRIGDILKELAPFLKLYTDYISNFDKANEALTTWTKKAIRMAEIISEIQKTSESENLTLGNHMLEPIQRIPRYKLLLTDYLSKLPSDSPDVKDCKDALEIISKSAQHANESMKSTERFKKLLEIQEKIGESFDLITASRDFIKEGDLLKVSARKAVTHQERTLVLFNDVLLCCLKFPGGTKYKVKVTMDLYGMEIGAVDEDEDLENAFRITSKQRVIDFAASSSVEKEAWVESLQKAIKELMEKRNTYKIARKQVVMDEVDLGRKAPAWIRDDEASMCMLCEVVFTTLRRRHHCRACGRVACSRCSNYKLALEYDGNKPNRVCVECYNVLVKGREETCVDGEREHDLLKISWESKIWMRGYLNYKGVGDRAWMKRWFVLSNNYVLYSHKGKKDTKAEFSFPLPGYSVDKPTLADEIDRKNVLKLHHKNVRVHFFEARDEATLKKWMHFLSFAVKAEQVEEDNPQDLPRDSIEEENQSR